MERVKDVSSAIDCVVEWGNSNNEILEGTVHQIINFRNGGLYSSFWPPKLKKKLVKNLSPWDLEARRTGDLEGRRH